MPVSESAGQNSNQYTHWDIDEHGRDYFVDVCCPKCPGTATVYLIFSCHTWPNSRGQWMSCLNGCSSAGVLYCSNEDCDWDYTWGLNPRNPQAADNEKNRPLWLVGGWPL